MTDKWTPGPWRRGKKGGYIVAPDGRREVTVCKVGAFHDAELVKFNKERWLADADLISAATDMAKSIIAMLKSYDDEDVDAAERAIAMQRAALAKARGRT